MENLNTHIDYSKYKEDWLIHEDLRSAEVIERHKEEVIKSIRKEADILAKHIEEQRDSLTVEKLDFVTLGKLADLVNQEFLKRGFYIIGTDPLGGVEIKKKGDCGYFK